MWVHVSFGGCATNLLFLVVHADCLCFYTCCVRVESFLCCAVCVFCPLCLPFDPLVGLGASSSSDCDAITLLAYSGAALLL